MVAFVGLCVAQTGMMSMLPVFWTLPTAFLTGAAAAGGLALINSVANIGGVLGATILGAFGLWSMAAILLHSLGDFNLYIPANAMTLSWIAGIAAGLEPG